MAKAVNKSEPINKKHLEDFLDGEDDFAFELKVLSICRNHSGIVLHGGTYQDPISRVNRQFDCRMWLESGTKKVAFAVECKNLSPYYPLLVSEMPRTKSESFHQVLSPGPFGCDIKEVKPSNSLYPAHQLVGKSTTQVGRALNPKDGFVGGDPEVYEKWSQAIASAADLVTNASLYKGPPPPNVAISDNFVLPLLVIPNKTLWTVEYTQSGERVGGPKQSNTTTLFLGKTYELKGPIGPFPMGTFHYWISHLHVYTVDGFIEFLNNTERDMNQWF